MIVPSLNPLNWFGRRTPLELRGTGQQPPPERVKPDETPLTGAQNQGAYGASGVMTYVAAWEQVCCQPVPVGDYSVYRAMDGDTAIVLSRAVVTAPVLEADKSYEARQGTPDEWVTLVQDCIDPLWPEFVREGLDAPGMGWKPWENVWGRREGRSVIVDLKPLAQELTTVLHLDGAFAGIRQAGPDGKDVDLSPSQCLILTIDGKNRDPYGRSWHENAINAWWQKLRCLVALAKLNRKASGMQVKVWYPPASDEATNHTNETKARTLAADYMAGGGAVFPNAVGSLTSDLAADFRNIQGLAESALWKMETEDHGNIGPQAAAILDQIRYYDAALSRAWYVPERAAQEAVTAGSRADSETASDVATSVSQQLLDGLCETATKAADLILVENFGERARGAVKVRGRKLRDTDAIADWKVIDSLLTDPTFRQAFVEQADIDAMLTRRGVPKLKDTFDIAERMEELRAERDAQEQKKLAAAGKVNGANGNGFPKLAMSREIGSGLALLGRVMGDGDSDGN